MANRRCIQTLIRRYLSTSSNSPSHSLHPILKALTLALAPHLLQTKFSTLQCLTPTAPPKFCSPFSSFSQHFCSSSRINSSSDNDIDEDDEEEDDDETEADEVRGNLSGKSDEEKAKEAAEIGYKVIGSLEESDRVFKPYEPVFAVIQVNFLIFWGFSLRNFHQGMCFFRFCFDLLGLMWIVGKK